MGIRALQKFLNEACPEAVKERDIAIYTGRTIAIDAANCIYQFLVAVRQADGTQLMSDDGDVTSHIQGMFSRTIRLIEKGIKPIFVFDGKPPEIKAGELEKRKALKQAAAAEAELARDKEDHELAMKLERRTVRMTDKHISECKQLLTLMGVPFVEAPEEAESQCCHMAKQGVVFAAASEDMDSLTLGAPVLVRHLTYAETRLKKEPILELHLATALSQLGITMDQFIDMCIMFGCDYTNTLQGIGPKTAYKFIKQYGDIEGIIKMISEEVEKGSKKYKLPENNEFDYVGARKMFKSPLVIDISKEDLAFKKPNRKGLIKFLCEEKQFNEERVNKSIDKLITIKSKGTQMRIDDFFTPKPKARK